jgi:hypothetical protein
VLLDLGDRRQLCTVRLELLETGLELGFDTRQLLSTCFASAFFSSACFSSARARPGIAKHANRTTALIRFMIRT